MTFGPANQVTLVRALLVAGLAALIMRTPTSETGWLVVAIAIVAAALDGVDGWVARRTHTATAFGERFDMETDAALIFVLAVLAWRYEKAGPWVILSGLLRYGFVASGWIWPWMRAPLTSTFRGKAICVVQIVALIVVVSPTVARPTSSLIAAGALFALGYSFLVDTLRLWHRTP